MSNRIQVLTAERRQLAAQLATLAHPNVAASDNAHPDDTGEDDEFFKSAAEEPLPVKKAVKRQPKVITLPSLNGHAVRMPAM